MRKKRTMETEILLVQNSLTSASKVMMYSYAMRTVGNHEIRKGFKPEGNCEPH